MTNDFNIEVTKNKIEELHSSGLSADEIIKTLNLPYDIDNTVSPTNQDLMRKEVEQGATEDLLKSLAALIAQLRSWKQDEALKSALNPELWEQYSTLKAEYQSITSKENITEEDRKRLAEISKRYIIHP